MSASARAIPIDPETEVARNARWWGGWDGFKAGHVRPSDIDAAQGWDAAHTAANIPTGRIAKIAKDTGNA